MSYAKYKYRQHKRWQKSQPKFLLSNLNDVLVRVGWHSRTSTEIPYLVEEFQLRPPNIIVDPALKLWLKKLTQKTLDALHDKLVAECTKTKLLGQNDMEARRANHIRNSAHHEIEYRKKRATRDQSSTLGP